jgi:hypothetical protein
MAASTDVNPGGSSSEDERTTKSGPANPQGSNHLDAPTPPGGPLRSDAPSGSATPGGPGSPVQPGQPEEPERPMRTIEEPVGRRGEHSATTPQEDNAESSQGEPSDDSGH